MFVLDDICKKCNYACEAIHFQQNFKNWTSGNKDIDKFIQSSQISAHSTNEIKNALEWIPYKRFYNIEYIAKGGFGTVYKANRIEKHKEDKNMIVALKFLDNSKNITLKFMNEVKFHYKEGMNNGFIVGFYGITQDPKAKNYVMVLEYAKNGSLRNYLDINYNKLSWKYKIYHLLNIACGVKHIHENELIHRNLHIGNVLMTDFDKITDMGLCKPADYNASAENTKNGAYGVLPYIAPEILRGQNYAKASDIYSFGIIICLDANPLNRPTANEIQSIIEIWRYKPSDDQTAELQRQIKEAEEANNNLSTCNVLSTHLKLSYETHSEAIYTSRLLNFNNLPEPKNSNDYYDEQNDNIISEEFSESLQIDVSQLNIIEDDQNI
ncbi:kinase-like domain-containing protein [Rhizophagus clarus]|uniref:Kinase-like domain-containing protein n=1 Tax=Rhizophagus clarus TaxID=94130 RepID=A0A8H3LFG2_9GLOM|nr:kinase-like domain-containing protein [Rhizophagus clarus]